jgi:hypothetical protein
MTNKNLPPIEYLHKRLRYEPETGKLFWRDCEEMPQRWRTRYAEAEAFTASDSRGYHHGSINGTTLWAHRVAYAIYSSEWPTHQIDHLNGAKYDNRIENLRAVTSQENNRNASMRSDNSSGVTGVCWNKNREKWQANISLGGRNKNLGLFDTIDAASSARLKASLEYGFTNRHGT